MSRGCGGFAARCAEGSAFPVGFTPFLLEAAPRRHSLPVLLKLLPEKGKAFPHVRWQSHFIFDEHSNRNNFGTSKHAQGRN